MEKDFIDSTDQLLDLLFDVMFAAVSPAPTMLALLTLVLTSE